MAPSRGRSELERRVVTPSATPSSGAACGRRPAPFDPFDQPIGRSGLPGAAALRRSGGRLGIVHGPRPAVRGAPTLDRDRWASVGAPDPAARARHGDHRPAAAGLAAQRAGRTAGACSAPSPASRTRTATGIEAVWFGRQFIERRIGPPGRLDRWSRARSASTGGTGHRSRTPTSSRRAPSDRSRAVTALLPVYRLTEGIRARTLRRAIRAAIDTWGRIPTTSAAPVRGDAGVHRLGHRDHPLPGRPGQRSTGPWTGWRSTSCWRSRWAWSRGVGSGSATTPRRSRCQRRAPGGGGRGGRADHRRPDRGTHRRRASRRPSR